MKRGPEKKKKAVKATTQRTTLLSKCVLHILVPWEHNIINLGTKPYSIRDYIQNILASKSPALKKPVFLLLLNLVFPIFDLRPIIIFSHNIY